MSYIYLQEQEGESSAECFSDIPAYVLSRLNLIAEKSFYKDKETEFFRNSQSGTMCEPLTASRGEEKSTSSVEDSLAKTYLAQERARESTEREVDCGLNLQESLARYDPATHLWKTRQCSLFEGLDECLETFPKAGTMQGGVLWELTMWERPISERECGYWRTPDAGAGGEISDEKAADYAAGKPRKSGSAIQIRLCDQVRHRRLYPTPTRSDYKGRGPNSKQQGLPEIVNGGIETPPTKTVRLNPAWVEWLMGWPIGWTDLKPLGMDKFRLWRQQHFYY